MCKILDKLFDKQEQITKSKSIMKSFVILDFNHKPAERF